MHTSSSDEATNWNREGSDRGGEGEGGSGSDIGADREGIEVSEEIGKMSDLTIIDGYRIRTSFNHPPIPDRRFDWSAWVDGEEESNIMGRGKTESEAVSELITTLDEIEELKESTHEQ